MSPTLRPTLKRPVPSRTPSATSRVPRPGADRRPFRFFAEVQSELKKVTWPSREQVQNLTTVVIAISVAVGVFLGAIDWVFAKIFEVLLGLV